MEDEDRIVGTPNEKRGLAYDALQAVVTGGGATTGGLIAKTTIDKVADAFKKPKPEQLDS